MMNWLQRVRKIGEFHIRMLKENKDWQAKDTAAAFDRNLTSVYEDITIYHWLKTHSKTLERFRTQEDAITWIRLRKKQMKEEYLAN